MLNREMLACQRTTQVLLKDDRTALNHMIPPSEAAPPHDDRPRSFRTKGMGRRSWQRPWRARHHSSPREPHPSLDLSSSTISSVTRRPSTTTKSIRPIRSHVHKTGRRRFHMVRRRAICNRGHVVVAGQVRLARARPVSSLLIISAAPLSPSQRRQCLNRPQIA